jgi:hypothetical protein
MTDTERFFRAAGYLFTWTPGTSGRKASIEMWRESADGNERFWVTRASCRSTRDGAYAGAMALVAWVQSLDVPSRRDPKAQAVLEQLAFTHDRLARLPRLAIAMVAEPMSRRASAA